MKILEISFHLQSGGAERFVVDLSNELAKTNEVTLLTLRDDKVSYVDRNFYKNDLIDAVKYECLGLKNSLRPSMWWKIWKYIRHKKPEVVHFHGDTMCYYMFLPMLFSSSKIKFVQTIHSDFYWGGYDKKLNKLTARILGNSHRIRYAALAKKNYDDLKKCYPNVLAECIVNGRSEIIPTVEYEDVKNEIDSYRTSDSTKIFLHVARCSKVKNQKRLICAFNQVISNGLDAQLLIIGDGFNEPLGQELRNLACDNIHFLGLKKNVSDYMLCSDIFCLSSDAEGMPITLLEAILSGTPAVSTPVCGALTAIKDDENGIIASSFAITDYVSALEKVVNNFNLLKSNSEKQKSTNIFTINKCAESYLKFFSK